MPSTSSCFGTNRRGFTCAALLALAFAAGAAPAAAKELHWAGIEVDAKVESDGTLVVSELQHMVFTGDWNGGERTFRIGLGQSIQLDRIVRIDPATGERRELVRGNLDEVDQWKWTSGNVLRWRSRRPTDPEFENTRIDYRLDYRLAGAFEAFGERRFHLDHDFVFPDREGVIEKVAVRITLAPEWRPGRPIPERLEGGPLQPGQSFLVQMDLELAPGVSADSVPRAAPKRLPPPVRMGAVAVFLAGALFFFGRLVVRDRALGRSGGGPESPVDRAWLEEKVFSLPPEVVGAAWDRNVGSAEVAALLARLTGEGKLASEVKTSGNFFYTRSDLHLRLLVPREDLVGYERPLIDALFGSSDTTDTESLRRRYRSTGFDPAGKIKGGLESRLGRLRGFASKSPLPSWKPTALLVLAGSAALLLAFILQPQERGPILAVGLGTTVFWLFLGLPAAMRAQGKVSWPFVPTLAALGSTAISALLLYYLGGTKGATWLGLLGAFCLALGLARATFNLFATRESAEGLVRRRDLLRARDHLRSELRKKSPDLEDRWFPYLLAFGLAPNADRWFRRFGDSAKGLSSYGSSSASSSFSGGGGGGWSGGGGAFGGAGATATWGMAATAMSAGVSAPSSSSSGGGGGGGSSGGGGGGGW